MGYVVTTAPSIEPVTLIDAKLHLRVDHALDDSSISTLITAARETVEKRSKRTLISTAYRLDQCEFATYTGPICIEKGPLIAVQSVKYYDTAGTLQTIASTNYRTDVTERRGYVLPVSGYVWPVVQIQRPNAVQVAFTAGYGTAATDVPAAARQAMLLLIGTWYENRESVSESEMMKVPDAADALIATVASPKFF